MVNMFGSEAAAVVATVDPDALTATTHDSDWVDAGLFHSLTAIVLVGTLGSSATFDAKLQQASDSSGTGAKDITGFAITQVTDAGSPDEDDSQYLINIRPSDLDLANGFSHVRLRITVATATCDGAGLILGFHPRTGPASDNDLSSVREIV